MNLDYDSYDEDLDLELLYGSHEPLDPLVREEQVNSDLQNMGRQYLE